MGNLKSSEEFTRTVHSNMGNLYASSFNIHKNFIGRWKMRKDSYATKQGAI